VTPAIGARNTGFFTSIFPIYINIIHLSK